MVLPELHSVTDHDDAQRVLDAIPLIVASCDAHARYTRVNRAYAARFGASPGDLLGRHIADIVGVDVFHAITPLIERVLAGERVETEMTLAYPDAGERTLRSVLTPAYDASGAIVGWDGVGEDVTERRATEVRLRDFAFLVQHTSDFIGMADLQFRPTFVNEAARRLSGARDPIGELSIFDFIAPEYHEFLREEFFPAVLRDGRATAEVEFLNVISGQRFWMEYGVVRMDDDRGEPTGYATISRSLDERKRSEALLRQIAVDREEALARIRELADSMPQMVWSAAAGGSIDYFNRRWYARTGTSRPDDVEATTFVHPEDRPEVERRWQASLASGLSLETEVRMRFPGESEYRWYLARTMPVKNAAGEIVRWYGTSTDIDRQKRIEQALATNQERLRAALDASETGTFRWDMRTNDLEWDENLDRLFGVSPGAVVRSLGEFVRLVHPDDRGRIVAACERCRLQGGDFEEEFRVTWPDGAIHWLYDKGRTHLGADGRPHYMTGACVDVTERRRKEDALRAADRQKDEFLGTLGHELRNPLAPLMYAVALLRHRLTEPDAQRPLEIINRQVTRISRLVEDLLDVSRITEGKITLKYEQLTLSDVIDHAVDVVKPATAQRQQTLDVRIADEVTVRGDAHRLGQVFENLLGNAAKYTPDGGEISIGIAREGREAVVRIRDNGVGIALEVLPRVFELFVQADNAVGHAPGGLGIGLTLVDRLTRLHGGSVSAHSAGVGQGAEFVVRLPLASDDL